MGNVFIVAAFIPAIASGHFRFNFESINSQRNVNRERLNPTKRTTTNAPVKFFKLRRETFLFGLGFFTFFTLGFSVALWRHGTEPGVSVVDQSNLYQFQYPCFKFAIILKFKVMRNRNILNSVDYPRLIVSV